MAPAFQVQPQSRRSAPPLPLALLLVPLLAAVLLTVFAWPQARSGPRDLPIGLAGPPGAVAGLERELAARAPGIEATAYPDAPAARDAIEDREVYGALTVGPDGVGVLTPRRPVPPSLSCSSGRQTRSRPPPEARIRHRSRWSRPRPPTPAGRRSAPRSCHC